MTARSPGRLVARVTHARHVPSGEREQFGLAVRDASGATVPVVLETCHRVEAYEVLPADARVDEGGLPSGARVLIDEEVVRHVIGVAVGLDSVVVGEDQILHQMRETMTAARASGRLDPLLERLFTIAIRAGRTARSWRQGPGLSLADLAVATIERRSGSLRDRRLLVVGAGKMGALAVRAGLAAGASVALTSRTAEHADALAARLGARPVAFDPGADGTDLAGVIVGLRGRWELSAETEEALGRRVATIVDLSVPSALSPGLVAALGDRHVSADDLAVVEAAYQADRAEGPLRRLQALVDESTAEFMAWLGGSDRRKVAEALAQRAEAEREAQVAQLMRRLPGLDPEARDAIDAMTRHFAARLLGEPLARLGRDADGRHERAARELFGL
jgi:glutamyl-tRNA reductase